MQGKTGNPGNQSGRSGITYGFVKGEAVRVNPKSRQTQPPWSQMALKVQLE
jgi:hypothetical protein